MSSERFALELCLLGLAAAGLGWAYLSTVARYYRVRRTPPTCVRLPTADGGTVTAYHRRPERRRFAEPVLLCHGLAVNHLNFDFDPPYSLAHHLAEAGFEVFSVDFRGTGPSRPPPGRNRFDFSADDYIAFDGPALVAHALEVTGASRAFWVGHSLGGLVGYGVAQGASGAKLAGLCALGSPVFFSYRPWLRRTVRVGRWLAWPRAFHQRWMSLALAPWLGYVTLPLSDVLVNPKNIPPRVQRKVYANLLQAMGYRLLAQFGDWIDHDAFRSADRRVDYRAGLATLSLPTLVMGGSRDQLAAAPAIEKQFELLGSKDKTLMIFGPERGEKLDYGHGDLLFGQNAPSEVYPRIRDWLVARASPSVEPKRTLEPSATRTE